MGIIFLKSLIVFFNFLVAILNCKVWIESKESRDFWATVAWIFAGVSWTLGLVNSILEV